MKELVEVIASALVDSPEDVVVTETEDEKQIVLNLTVAPEDMGKVIGKRTYCESNSYRCPCCRF